ncbi:MAG: tRNA epoxyqueuosine(34) reductase QueG [Planctomycetaceae bacterium]|nr:tRNA epoxyqueuosine(34) reductase QueG [Planctomycetaceae bacterium]
MSASVDHIKQRTLELGFAACGIAPAQPTAHRRHVVDWIADGRHGDMSWLARNLNLRLDPAKFQPDARSIICVADHISAAPAADGNRIPSDSPYGRVARYAQISDYHKVLKKRLHRLADDLRTEHPDALFRVCVDTAPVLEREHAARTALGWVGKHTLLLHPQLGSHLLLGVIVTSLDLPHDTPHTDHCGTCTRCIDACPTQCITPWSVDAARCISYLTIEHRGPIDPQLHEAIGDHLFGCDVCQDVCPFNQGSEPADLPPGYEPRASEFNLLTVLGWSEADRRAAFVKSAMKRAKLPQIKRNALIAAANALRDTDHKALRDRARAIATDATEDDIVRETARDVINRLNAER